MLARQRLAAACNGSEGTRVQGPVEYRSPEDYAVADDLLQRLRAQLGRNTRVAAVLDGMLRELPSSAISSTSGIRCGQLSGCGLLPGARGRSSLGRNRRRP
jgi:hypothetical protein